jgi:Protein of unknown function, DUF547
MNALTSNSSTQPARDVSWHRPRQTLVRLATLACLLALLAGCATVPAPRVAESALSTQTDPYAPWAEVLASKVDPQGRVDFDALAIEHESLDRFVAWIYRVSPRNTPTMFPTREHVLAYHLNAYNALAMYHVLIIGTPHTLAGLRKISFFALKRLQVGGEPISLYAYENDVIRAMQEPRVHFALNCMSVSCPRLPREPFRAETLDAQLEREARFFFNESRNVRVDPHARRVYLSEILDFFTEDFLAHAPSLLDYVNRYRTAAVPSDYQVEFIPYDWTVHRQ